MAAAGGAVISLAGVTVPIGAATTAVGTVILGHGLTVIAGAILKMGKGERGEGNVSGDTDADADRMYKHSKLAPEKGGDWYKIERPGTGKSIFKKINPHFKAWWNKNRKPKI